MARPERGPSALPRSPKKPPGFTDYGSCCRFAHSIRVALAKQALERRAHIGIELSGRFIKVLKVVQHIFPLSGRVFIFRVNASVDVLEGAGNRPAVRYAQTCYPMAAFGVMAGNIPNDRATPIVPNPDSLLAVQVAQQSNHVAYAVLQGIVFCRLVDR